MRANVGPVLIGLAVWCAAGTIATSTPDAASLRLAVPASWWWGVGGVALAMLVPRWRRDPRFALPALASTLPWWPVPLPAAALIFTGPLAWVPIGVALAAAVGAAPLRAAGRWVMARDARRAPWLAAILTLAIGAAAAWSAAPQVPGGDEPHYLIITQSLWLDGDLKIQNNHDRRDYAAYYGGEIHPDRVVNGKNGEVYSIHAPGLPAIVLPAFAAFGYRGAQATVLLLAALTAALIWQIGWLATRDAGAAWFAWAAVAGSIVFVIESFSIYPEVPGAFAVACGALLLVRLDTSGDRVSAASLALASVPLAALPWLHTRFAVVAVGFGLVIVWRLMSRSGTPVAAAKRILVFLAAPLASAVGWFAYFKLIYGSFNPAAPYGDTTQANGTHLAYIPGGLLGLLFDGQWGLLIYTPVLILAALWWRRADAGSRRTGLAVFAVALAYAAAAATYWMWWAGIPAPPARFLTVILPVFALPLAVVWAGADERRRRVALALLLISCAITIALVAVDRATLAWNDRDAQARWLAWLGPIVNLRRGVPSFFWRLTDDPRPGNLASEWAFAVHAGAWTIGWIASWSVVRALARRPGRPASTAGVDGLQTDGVAVAWWLIGGLVLVVQTGWWLNGRDSLDPAHAQYAVLEASRRAGGVVEIGPFEWRTGVPVEGRLTIATEEPGRRTDPAATWFTATALPAGTYDLVIRQREPEARTLTVRLGDSSRPLALPAARQSSFTIRPQAAGPVSIGASPPGTGARVLLTPR